MQLDALSLDELNKLSLHLRALHGIGETLAACDLQPIFCLIPGEAATITLPVIMPPVAIPSLPSELSGAADDAPPAVEPAVAGVDAPPQDAIPSAPEASTLLPEADGPDGAAATGAQTPVPPADLDNLPDRPAPWTPEEDARLVKAVARDMAGGIGLGAAATRAALDLGRPVEGTKFRLKNKLRNALAAALVAQAPIAAVEQTPVPQVDGGSLDGGGADRSTQAPAVTSVTQKPEDRAMTALQHHLGTITRPAPWTLQRDDELMALATSGWGIPEIATEMQIDGREIRKRWDQLTGAYLDANAKLVRRFPAVDVAQCLNTMLAAQG